MRNMVAIPLLLVVPLAGQAQQLPTFISSAGSDTAPAAPAAAFGHPDDYCLEGLIAGAVLVGGAFTAIIIGLCPYSDSCETGDALLVSLGRSHSAVSPAPSSAAQYRKPHQPPHLRHRCLQQASNPRFELARWRGASLSLAWQVPWRRHCYTLLLASCHPLQNREPLGSELSMAGIAEPANRNSPPNRAYIPVEVC
jgi:hypothetical protein